MVASIFSEMQLTKSLEWNIRLCLFSFNGMFDSDGNLSKSFRHDVEGLQRKYDPLPPYHPSTGRVLLGV